MQGYLVGRPQPISYYAGAVGRTARKPTLRAVAN
jgi:hypothetical protein